jgi:hypothetical protein
MKKATPSRQDLTTQSSPLSAILYRIVLTALAQASLVLVACMMAGSLSGQGLEPYLRSAVLAFSLFGSFTLGQGIRAERSSAHDRAGHLYALALVNHFVAYASVMAHRLLEASNGP